MAGPTPAQAKEIIRCGKDPVYFINKFAKIQHPQRGTIKFATYEFQDDCVRSFIEHRFNIVVKARQLGLSTITAIYAVWLAIFYRDKNILIIATKLSTAKNFIKKVKVAMRCLPPWLVMPGIVEQTQQHISFSNGSQIKAIPTSEDAGRSEALSLLVVDEAAFIRNFADLWKGLYSCLSEGGRAIVISTPNGIGGRYHELVEGAKNKTNDFNYIKLLWNVHPGRDEEWLRKESKNMTPTEIAQELMCDFAASGDTFVTTDVIEKLSMQIENPIEKWGPGGNIWQWKYPQPDDEFIISADVSRGDSADYSAFQVLNKNTCEQVCEFKGKIRPDQFGILLSEVGKRFNDAEICPENNTYGQGTILKLVELGYKNLYFKTVKAKFDMLYGSDPGGSLSKIGITTSVATRGPMLRVLEERLRNNTLRVRSSRVVEELKTFVMKGKKAKAKKGKHDDVLMALAIGNSLISAGGWGSTRDVDISRAMLGGFAVNGRHKEQQRPVRHINNLNPLVPIPSDVYASQQRMETLPEEFDWLLK